MALDASVPVTTSVLVDVTSNAVDHSHLMVPWVVTPCANGMYRERVGLSRGHGPGSRDGVYERDRQMWATVYAGDLGCFAFDICVSRYEYDDEDGGRILGAVLSTPHLVEALKALVACVEGYDDAMGCEGMRECVEQGREALAMSRRSVRVSWMHDIDG